MRRMIVAGLAFALMAGPGLAQTAPTAPPSGPVVQTPAAPPAAKPAAKPRRAPFAERFDAANTTHDGRLTLDQARAGKLRGVMKNFAAIDAGKKGYVTKADIETFRKTEKGKKAAL